MKRTHPLAAGALCLLLAAALLIPASAHGCHGGRSRGHHGSQRQWVQTSVTVCAVEDCATAGRHSHGGVIYCGYNHESGLCDNTCRALCTLEDCCETGRHLHDGVTYCGYDHESGFCDGSCAVSVSCGGCHSV